MAIFRQFYQQLGLQDSNSTPNSKAPNIRQLETQRLWSNVAALITKSQRCRQKRQCFSSSNNNSLCQRDGKESADAHNDQLNKILYFENLTLSAYEQIHKYLTRAFESPHHPLGTLLNDISAVYTATYGGVRVHPLLLEHAVSELRSITRRIYEAMTLFFPVLPTAAEQCILKPQDDDDDQCNEE